MPPQPTPHYYRSAAAPPYHQSHPSAPPAQQHVDGYSYPPPPMYSSLQGASSSSQMNDSARQKPYESPVSRVPYVDSRDAAAINEHHINIPPHPSQQHSDGMGADDSNWFDRLSKAHYRQTPPRTRNTALFLAKVYAVLFFQLSITTGVVALFLLVPPLNSFAKNYFFSFFFGSMILSIVLLVILFCVRRVKYVNLLVLTVFTVVFSLAVGMITGQYSLYIILQAMLITTFVTVLLSAVVISTKARLMWMGNILCAGLLILIVTSLVGSLFSFVWHVSPWWHMLISGFAALLFSLFIAYDTSLLIHRFSDEDALIASVNLYLDIVNLFLAMLSLIGLAQRR